MRRQLGRWIAAATGKVADRTGCVIVPKEEAVKIFAWDDSLDDLDKSGRMR
jgi:hypothetical protein